MAGYPVHRPASAGDHAGSCRPPDARLGHVIRYILRGEAVTGKIMPLRAGHKHDPGRGRRLLVLAAVCEPEYSPLLHRQFGALASRHRWR
jgi:hypothetical protein